MQKKEDQGVNFPFWEGLLFPLNVVYNKNLNKLLCLFALISAILVMTFGQSLACTFGLNGSGIYCMKNPWGFVCLMLLQTMLTAGFINRSWAIAFGGKNFSEAIKMRISLKDLKILGFMGCFLGALILIGGGVYFLLKRKATPDLDLELGIFFAVSLLILTALFFVINAVVFAFFLDGRKWFVFNKTFWPMFDNIYKLIIWFLCYLLFLGYLVSAVKKVFDIGIKFSPVFWGSLLGQFAMQFVFYLMVIFFLSMIKYQAYYILKDEH